MKCGARCGEGRERKACERETSRDKRPTSFETNAKGSKFNKVSLPPRCNGVVDCPPFVNVAVAVAVTCRCSVCGWQRCCVRVAAAEQLTRDSRKQTKQITCPVNSQCTPVRPTSPSTDQGMPSTDPCSSGHVCFESTLATRCASCQGAWGLPANACPAAPLACCLSQGAAAGRPDSTSLRPDPTARPHLAQTLREVAATWLRERTATGGCDSGAVLLRRLRHRASASSLVAVRRRLPWASHAGRGGIS